MFVELRRENTVKETGAIPGKLYIDGKFFAYTLENSNYNIPSGFLDLYDRISPKFGTKVHVEVPGRSFILFHGGNTPEDSKGCILIAANRINESRIQGDQSNTFYDVVKTAWNTGEKVTFVVYRPLTLFAIAAAAFGFYLITKK